jgi:endonuclease G, mitochondrial
MKNNNFIWMAIFVMIGSVLYLKEKPGIFKTGWDGIFSKSETKTNPYKTPEPDSEASAANNKQTSKEADKQEEASVFDDIMSKVKSKVSEIGTESQSEESSDLPDWALPAVKKNDQIVVHSNYTLSYNEKHEQANWVCYQLKGESTRGTASRADHQFEPDNKVKTKSALSSDYIGTGYDRGHLAPAGDFKCCQNLMNETFVMSNISPQNSDFNRGIWGNLEERIRSWARRDESIIIVTGPILKDGLETIGRYNKVSVPEEFYKIVLLNHNGQKRAIGFILENKPLFGSIVYDFAVPINEIERRTGIDFFEKLPDTIENELESQASWEEWNKRKRN